MGYDVPAEEPAAAAASAAGGESVIANKRPPRKAEPMTAPRHLRCRPPEGVTLRLGSGPAASL